MPEPASPLPNVSPLTPEELAALRRSYSLAGLDEENLRRDPMEQFSSWLAEAAAADVLEPNAMVVSTADAQGRPSSRTVLLKAFDSRGFVFFTNYRSRKGRQIAENTHVSLLFPWYALERQVGVVGEAGQASREETEAYFRTRPRGSQLGAWASDQSQVIESRNVLAAEMRSLERRFPPGTDVPVPEWWGGVRVVPRAVEFWQGRESRLHDRLRYRRSDDGWVIERLAP